MYNLLHVTNLQLFRSLFIKEISLNVLNACFINFFAYC